MWLRLVAISTLLLGCTKAQPQSTEVTVPPAPASTRDAGGGATPIVLANPELRFIVPAAEGRNFYFRDPPPTFYTPTDREISAFEAKLPAFLRASVPPSRRGATPLADRMPKYMRQYVGHLAADGTRLIWGNFFCSYYGDADGWRKEGFVVKDGGDCYFNVDFVPDGETFRNLAINGDA